MRFIFLFISAISIQCYAASEAMELHYCETVKKAASGVMDARQHEVPAKELHDIANHLEEQQAKQLYQELIKSAYSSKQFEDPLIKSKAVENFQTTWHEQCLAKELAKNM
ncbi:envelope fusion protein [Acinetobacter baumannii]|nr:envelope fusion protein [Acinetobacter baumannii]MDC5406620.1 envelope fusion protein [Acinetobacter baumannii]MDC5413916.1 envelope fusion protein [Acinetobacter baumannii]MDC5682824.1 envelope fusion protein [Acinetobacter baumannii]HCV3301829.1 hypothetical protein [Acinetobacter baumannii]